MRLVDERLDCVLQGLSVTPFVTFKGCLAAWAVAPTRFDVLGEERFDTADDYTIAALEIPFEDAHELLKIDPAIQGALAATEEGRLFDGYQSVQHLMAAIGHGLHPRKAPVYHFVTEKLCENSAQLMEAACWAALCGRTVPDAGDSVSQCAVLLYHRFAYNFVDREKNPVVRPRRVSTGCQTAVDSKPGPDLVEEEAKRRFTKQWQELGYDAAAEKLLCLIDYVLQAEQDWIDEKFVSTIRPPLDGWPPGWKRPEGFSQALRRLHNPCK